MTVMDLAGLTTSLRTTVVLLCALAFLLLLNVVVPQESVVGEEGFSALVAESPVASLFLDKLGLGRIETHPLFVVTLALFFVNLTAVLIKRTGATWRRIRLRPKSVAAVNAWSRVGEKRTAELPSDWSMRHVISTLQGFGFQARKVSDGAVWAVKHRTAPLGFLLFHLSFFFLAAGGISLYLTRFVGAAVLAEGQSFDGQYIKIARMPALGGEPGIRFFLQQVDVRFEMQQPVHLAATVQLLHGAQPTPRTARVNHPVNWGPVSLLVQRAGLTPVFWLQDNQGFTLHRGPVMTAVGPSPTLVQMADESIELLVSPTAPDGEFAEREELSTTPIHVELFQEEKSVARGTLVAGEALTWSGGRLLLEEVRYWAGFQVISERGGAFLIAGFLMAVIGLVWRMLWYRREVAVTWDAGLFSLVGSSEYYRARSGDELDLVFRELQRSKGGERS